MTRVSTQRRASVGLDQSLLDSADRRDSRGRRDHTRTRPVPCSRPSRMGGLGSPVESLVATTNNMDTVRQRQQFVALQFLSSIFFFFFSSPNLSGHRLDVYHTSTHDMALVRI